MMSGEAMIRQAIEAVRLELAERLLAVAQMVLDEHQRRLGILNPPPYLNPARPGNYPRLRTGRLRGSFRLEPDTPAAVAAAGGVRIVASPEGFYGDILAARGFLGLNDTLTSIESRIATILARPA